MNILAVFHFPNKCLTFVEACDSLYRGQRKKNKSCCDLDLGRTVPNVELVGNILILWFIWKINVKTS